ncbi:MAG: hypothetical protein LAP40_07650 [Acidobacteriia bacterium]|nr:hypothetical protein [Terriglobia bacterium]
MKSTRPIVYGCLAAALAVGPLAAAEKVTRPAPTPADWAALAKLPDLTGVWEMAMGGPPRAAARGATPPAGGPPPDPAFGARLPRAGRGRAPQPSLTPEYAAKAKAEGAKPGGESQTANCLPPGLPEIMSQPYPMEFLLTPGQVTIVIEAYSQVRHIYTDGRALPADPDPTFYGTSVGHWEGDTLVAESVGFENIPRGVSFPYSGKMKVVERFRLADPDTMSIETTIVDPEALTQPFSMGARTLKRHRNWTIAEYVCEENNRNFVDSKGDAGINLANPEASPK